jgi:hypothetical protein
VKRSFLASCHSTLRAFSSEPERRVCGALAPPFSRDDWGEGTGFYGDRGISVGSEPPAAGVDDLAAPDPRVGLVNQAPREVEPGPAVRRSHQIRIKPEGCGRHSHSRLMFVARVDPHRFNEGQMEPDAIGGVQRRQLVNRHGASSQDDLSSYGLVRNSGASPDAPFRDRESVKNRDRADDGDPDGRGDNAVEGRSAQFVGGYSPEKRDHSNAPDTRPRPGPPSRSDRDARLGSLNARTGKMLPSGRPPHGGEESV